MPKREMLVAPFLREGARTEVDCAGPTSAWVTGMSLAPDSQGRLLVWRYLILVMARIEPQTPFFPPGFCSWGSCAKAEHEQVSPTPRKTYFRGWRVSSHPSPPSPHPPSLPEGDDLPLLLPSLAALPASACRAA